MSAAGEEPTESTPAGTTCRIALPAGCRTVELFALHGRDRSQTAERVHGAYIDKGLMWRGRPAMLNMRVTSGEARVTLTRAEGAQADAGEVEALARHLLGLTQPIVEFERHHRDHAQVGPLIAARPGLCVPQAATPFEALSWAVTGQQISLSAALAIRARLILAAGVRYRGDLYCYPDAARLATVPDSALRGTGLSAAKAATLRNVCAAVADGRLPLDGWRDAPPVAEIRAALREIRGIGPWTIDYALLRGFAWVDGSLHGDAALRRALGRLLGGGAPPTVAEAERWLAPFAPWRALVAAHLWAFDAEGRSRAG